jgi:hypothetical protein
VKSSNRSRRRTTLADKAQSGAPIKKRKLNKTKKRPKWGKKRGDVPVGDSLYIQQAADASVQVSGEVPFDEEQETATSPESLQAPEYAESLQAGKDAYGVFVTLHNDSVEGLPTLKGFKMRFISSQYTLEFPDVPFNHGDAFQIRMGAEAPEGFHSNGRGILVPPNSWATTGDMSYLLSPEEQVVAKFDILGAKDAIKSNTDKRGCLVM